MVVRVESVTGCCSATRVPSRSFVSVPIGCGGCWLLSRAGLMSWVVVSSGKLGFYFIQGLVPLQGGRGSTRIRCKLSFCGLRPSCSSPFRSRLWVSPWPPGGGLVRESTGHQGPHALGWGFLVLLLWFVVGFEWCSRNGRAALFFVFLFT